MALLHGKLHLLEPSADARACGPRLISFSDLWRRTRRKRRICIVLSGTGTEGAMGLRAIKGEGGMVMVQEPGVGKV